MSTVQIKNAGRDNLYSLSYRDANAANGAEGDPVSGVHLRRIEPGHVAQGRGIGQGLSRRADQELRGQAGRSRVQAEGLSPSQHRVAHGRRQGLGVAPWRTGRAAEPGAPGAARGRAGARRGATAAGGGEVVDGERGHEESHAGVGDHRVDAGDRRPHRRPEAQSRFAAAALHRAASGHHQCPTPDQGTRRAEAQGGRRAEAHGHGRARRGNCHGLGQPGLPGDEPDAGHLGGAGGVACAPAWQSTPPDTTRHAR